MIVYISQILNYTESKMASAAILYFEINIAYFGKTITYFRITTSEITSSPQITYEKIYHMVPL